MPIVKSKYVAWLVGCGGCFLPRCLLLFQPFVSERASQDAAVIVRVKLTKLVTKWFAKKAAVETQYFVSLLSQHTS